ncbi:glycosyltransferase family 2 protein [Maricaulis sp.]|uniref:glycosyltransferase family 2 protein n=1 Tax=Maricaulis sp. TaxID=1486257 RepID=UPI003A9421ED
MTLSETAPDRPIADVAVLIVAYRSRATLDQCIAALAAQTVMPRQVFVLENGSPAGERIDAARLPNWVNFVASEDNLGFAGGNNRLAEMADSEWLALLNPDAFARPDWLEQFLVATDRYPDISLFGSTQYAANFPGLLDGVGDVYHATGLAYRAGYMRPVALLPDDGEVFAICGAAAFWRRSVFDALGGFDERFFCYNEDVDLAYRAKLQGYRAVQLRDAAVEHLGYASSGRRSEFATYYGVRNRLWVFMKNTPGWLFWVLSPLHAGVTALLWLSAARFGQFTVFGRALRDALKGRHAMMASRRDIQHARVTSPSTIARAMSWNPARLLTRAPDVRPMSAARPGPSD